MMVSLRVGPGTPEGRELDKLSHGISKSVCEYDMANPLKAEILYEDSRPTS